MDNKRNKTAKTAQTSIINHYRQSKDKYELERIINHYKELDTRMDSRPEQHKDKPQQKKRVTLITAIAITIMAIATTSAAAAHIVAAAYGTNNKDEQRNKEDMVSRIKRATMKKPQVTRKQAFATHIKQGTKTTQTRKNGRTKSTQNTTPDTGKDNHVS
jgi:hypothetical protein